MQWNGFLFLIISLSLTMTSCKEPPKEVDVPRPVKAFQISDPKLIHSRPFPGVARAENRVNLSFRVDGPLITLPIDVGDEVKKDDILARIDPRDYEINLRNAQANLAKSKAALTFAESDFERAERIQKEDPGAISESKVDEKREERNRLRAQVQGNDAQVAAAMDQLSYTFLRAPFDGMIVAKYFDNFEYVRARQPVARMLDTSRIEMVVDVPENMIPYTELIKKVVVTIDSFPNHQLEASIKEIGTEASTTTRTFPVTLVMKQPEDITILAGMSGEAQFVGAIEPDAPGIAIIIPTSAVFSESEEGPDYVWVINEQTHQVNKRVVQLEGLTSKGIRVVEGLQSNEWIAIAGVHFLKEGQEVDILKPEDHVE